METYENHRLEKTTEYIKSIYALLSKITERIEEIRKIKLEYLEMLDGDENGIYQRGIDSCDELTENLEEQLISLGDLIDKKIRELKKSLVKNTGNSYVN